MVSVGLIRGGTGTEDTPHRTPPDAMITEVSEPDGVGSVTVARIRCECCGGAMALDTGYGRVSCIDPDCSAAGVDTPLWRVLDRQVAAGRWPDPNPVGRPRPVDKGTPIPWLVPVIPGLGPQWRMVHRARLAAAQLDWLCQVCGELADTVTEVIIDTDGWCLTSAPIHPVCAEIAARWCPATRRYGRRLVVRSGDEHRVGEVDRLGLFTQDWQYALPSDDAPVPPAGLSSWRDRITLPALRRAHGDRTAGRFPDDPRA